MTPMPQTLVMDPDADVEQVVQMNADDYGEDGYEILRQSEADGRLFVTVEWESETERICYIRTYTNMSEGEREAFKEHIESGPYQVEETSVGNLSVNRDKSWRETREEP